MKSIQYVFPNTFPRLFLKSFIKFIVVLSICWYLALTCSLSEAAVAPNKQPGECGPCYIWYQVSPDSFPPLMEYVDLYGITFDISAVVSDFDFVYFTDTARFQRASLDKNQDGVSDLFFVGRTQNQLKWKPDRGYIRINLQECQEPKFNKRCGFAMISIQPKHGFQSGSARIPVRVHAKCPPNGMDCSRTYTILHDYDQCFSPELPEFTIQQHTNLSVVNRDSDEINFYVDIQNTGGSDENSAVLTNSFGSGTEGGTLRLIHIEVDCPIDATCSIVDVDTTHLNISLRNLPKDKVARVRYLMKAKRQEIPLEKISYFTNTATLSTGGSSRVTVGVRGAGTEINTEPGRREERPIPSSR